MLEPTFEEIVDQKFLALEMRVEHARKVWATHNRGEIWLNISKIREQVENIETTILSEAITL